MLSWVSSAQRLLHYAVWASIDESSGKVRSGGRGMPFIPGTVPERSGAAAGQVTTEEFMTGGLF